MTTHDPEALLAHQAWMRRLAGRLARDAGEAEDLVQEAWVAALKERGPVGDVAGWLATVLRNSARSLRRGEARATAREAAAARGERLPASDAVVARMQEQRVLLAALDALEEPYRTTILLRFYEELPPRVIARRTGVPVETVKTRLKRGLARLRAALEAHHGGREAWLAALLPLLRPTEGALLPLGTLLMQKPLKVLVLVLLVGGGVFGWYAWPRTGEGSAQKKADEPLARSELVASPLEPDAPRAPQREARTLAPLPLPTSAAPEPAPTNALRSIPGRAFQPDGRALAGVRVGQRAAPARAVATDADGRFVLPTEMGAGSLVVLDAGWTTVFYGTEEASEAAERILVAAPAVELAGVVVDELGAPIAGVELPLEPPEGFRARFPAVLDYSGRGYSIAISDEAGRFALADAPRIEGSTLASERSGFVAARFPVPFDGRELRLVLTRLAGTANDLRGRVLDPDGASVAGAHVACGEAGTQSDARGEFALARAELGDEHTLAVVVRGQQPVRVEFAPDEEYVLVRLVGPALTLSGRVRYDDGEPVAGARVWVSDPSKFGNASALGMDATSEGLAVSTMTRADLARLWNEDEGDPATQRFRSPSLPMWSFVRADEQGRFTLGGLAARDYTLRAMDERTLQMVTQGPFAAGSTGLELELPRAALWPRLAGRVLDTDGNPVADASLSVGTTGLALHWGNYTTYRGETRGEEAVTDAEGRFELVDVPHSALLAVTGDHIERTEFGSVRTGGLEQAVGGSPGNVTIVARPRFHLRIDASATPELADSATVLDAEGRTLWCERIEGSSYYGRQEIELVEGRSGSWNLPPEARTLVLRKVGAEVKRLELFLVPRSENLITP